MNSASLYIFKLFPQILIGAKEFTSVTNRKSRTTWTEPPLYISKPCFFPKFYTLTHVIFTFFQRILENFNLEVESVYKAAMTNAVSFVSESFFHQH